MVAHTVHLRIAAVFLTAFLGWHAPVPAADAPANPTAATEEDEAPLDINFIKERAEAGKPRAQMQLADLCLMSGDATNAVVWYRKAAAQDEVGAQIALASCLITGRGVPKDHQEAARWLQRAAALIGGSNAVAVASSTAASVTNSGSAATLAAGSAPAAAASAAVAAPPASAAKPAGAPTPTTRVPRVAALQTNAPALQGIPSTLRSYSDSR